MSEDQADQTETEQFEDDSTPEEMTEAKSLGWKSPVEWKGEPPKNGFKKAKDFLEHGRTVLPIVQSENAKLKRELADARREASEKAVQTAAKLDNMERMSKTALNQLRRQLVDKYETAKEAAVEVGDTAAYRKIDKEGKDALKEFDAEAADKPVEGENLDAKKVDRVPEIDDWIDENKDWFNKNKRMTRYAIEFQAELQSDGVALKKSLDETLKEVKKRFPEHFDDEPAGKDDEGEEDQPKRKGSPVESGGSRIGGGSQRSAWSRLPAEAQKQADSFIKEDGLFLNKDETVEKDLQKARERYAKQYHGEEA